MSANGFTLIELLVALTLASLGVAIGAGIFTNASDAIGTAERQVAAAEQEAAGITWAQEALLATLTTSTTVRGTPDSLTFATNAPVAAGWVEPMPAAIRTKQGRVALELGSQEHLLPDSVVTWALDYLESYGADSPWLSEWLSLTQAPLAVRMRRTFVGGAGDTLLLYVGRGR